MKLSTVLCFLLFVGGVIVSLIQLWFQFWNADMFLKIIMTDGALLVVSFVLAFLIKENKESAKIRSGNSLD